MKHYNGTDVSVLSVVDVLGLSHGFWANGGHAEALDLDDFIYYVKTLSGSDILVLAWTLEDFTMREKPEAPLRALEPFS